MILGEKPTEIALLRDPKSAFCFLFLCLLSGKSNVCVCGGGSYDPLNVESSAFIYIEGTGVSESQIQDSVPTLGS